MPYTVTGKVLDEYGEAIGHTVVITEKPVVAGQLTIADVWADADGSFTISALSNTSQIEISAYGYTTQSFAATAVPSVIKLQPALVITGSTKQATPLKKDNRWLWLGAAAIVLAGVAIADKSKPATGARATRTRTTKPGLSRPAKMVIV
jgi:hypothetical protein